MCLELKTELVKIFCWGFVSFTGSPRLAPAILKSPTIKMSRDHKNKYFWCCHCFCCLPLLSSLTSVFSLNYIVIIIIVVVVIIMIMIMIMIIIIIIVIIIIIIIIIVIIIFKFMYQPWLKHW